MELPHCAECRVRIQPGDKVLFRTDGRIQHVACPKVSCFVCGSPVEPGTPIRRHGEDLVHSNCWPRLAPPDTVRESRSGWMKETA
jgi:hypothetical protein